MYSTKSVMSAESAFSNKNLLQIGTSLYE